jgi:signal transduction histidine kinase
MNYTTRSRTASWVSTFAQRRRPVPGRPDDAQSALEEITATSADALTELRTTLKILRDTEDEAPLRPAQTLAHLDDLLDNARRAGLQVHATVSSLSDLPGATSHAAYRILQEALTNVLRHSDASSASVSVHADGKTLTLEVADDGVVDEMAVVAGHGLHGVAERAAALGGLCEAGLLPEGGWRVRASLPLRSGAA